MEAPDQLDLRSRPDLRFVSAASQIRAIEADPAGPTPGQAFAVLRSMWCGVNRFSLVFDPRAMRVYFTTYRSRSLRWVDFASFGFACGAAVPCLDIHQDLAGDTAGSFVPFTDAANRVLLKSFFAGVDAGFWGNLVWKPTMVRQLQAWQRTVKCPE